MKSFFGSMIHRLSGITLAHYLAASIVYCSASFIEFEPIPHFGEEMLNGTFAIGMCSQVVSKL
jgi:succinate dehydrogenase/fumarate reductase cytochrome b subunit